MNSLKKLMSYGFQDPIILMRREDYAELLRFAGVSEDEVQRRLAILDEEPTQEIEVDEDET